MSLVIEMIGWLGAALLLLGYVLVSYRRLTHQQTFQVLNLFVPSEWQSPPSKKKHTPRRSSTWSGWVSPSSPLGEWRSVGPKKGEKYHSLQQRPKARRCPSPYLSGMYD